MNSLLFRGTAGGCFCWDPISDVFPAPTYEISCPPNYLQTAAVAGISPPAPGPPAGQMGRLIGKKLAVCLEIPKKGTEWACFRASSHTFAIDFCFRFLAGPWDHLIIKSNSPKPTTLHSWGSRGSWEGERGSHLMQRRSPGV